MGNGKCKQAYKFFFASFSLDPSGARNIYVPVHHGVHRRRYWKPAGVSNRLPKQVDALAGQLLHCQFGNLRFSRWSFCAAHEGKAKKYV